MLAEARAAGSSSGLPTLGYGVGCWYLTNGQPERTSEIFRSILEVESRWAAFFIAAEAELPRMERGRA